MDNDIINVQNFFVPIIQMTKWHSN